MEDKVSRKARGPNKEESSCKRSNCNLKHQAEEIAQGDSYPSVKLIKFCLSH